MPNYARRLLANSEPPSACCPHYYHLRLGTTPPRYSGKRLGWPIRKPTPGDPEPFNLALYSLSFSLSSSFEDLVSLFLKPSPLSSDTSYLLFRVTKVHILI